MAVHLPIALAMVWPFVDGIGLVFRRQDVCRVGFGLLVVAVLAALAASVTGQAAYDVALDAGVAPTLLDTHASNAELVPWILLVVAVLRGFAPKKFGRGGHAVVLALGLAVLALVMSVGASGGDLVFEHRVGVSEAKR